MLSKSIRRPICSYVCQSCLSRSVALSSTVIRRHNHGTFPIQPDAPPQSNSVGVKPNEGGSIEGTGSEKSLGGKKKGKGKEKADANKASKSTQDAPSVQSANTQVVPEIEEKSAKTRKSKSKTRKKKAAAQTKKLAGNSDENIKNMILIQQKSKLRLKKLRPSKVIAALNLAAQNGKSKSGKASKGGLDEFAPVRSASPKLTSEVTLGDIEILPLNTESDEVPSLSYGLDRVLFNPGVYQLQDPRTMVYNFDPYLRDIMPVSEFDFKALNDYITSSKDTVLKDKAIAAGKKYIGSSSSMTGVLSHFHFLLSEWRELNTSHLSNSFPATSKTYTKLSRLPAVVFLRYKDGVYAVDADKEWDTSNVLMGLGKSMEKLLTIPRDQYERYRRNSPDKILKEDSPPEVYHYSTCGDFLMRSQLDAYDPRLPGTGMFDLKTRAVVSIRMDAREPWNAMGYQIKTRLGDFESFEREYYDMMRSAFLKYHLQVRIGRMDGIFVAFHNIKRIFGFQYISLPEMDKCIHGQEDTALGDAEFKLSLNIWNKVIDVATEAFPKQSLRFHFDTRETQNPFMYIFAEPMTEEDITKIQERNLDEIQAYEKRVFYPELLEAQQKDSLASETENPTEQEPELKESASGDEIDPEKPLLAMALSIRNFVNGNEVDRPTKFTANDTWTVKYQLAHFGKERGWTLYNACKKRRSRFLGALEDDEAPNSAFKERLNAISKDGQKWRDEMDKIEKAKGIIQYQG
ncbi:mitochondrial membrane protein Pet127 [Nannizzia gypsea CBS 118893]|uniref:Mitochondrial membrane protein Pet127 n=1 Tax=Arthroderma gypseum (strain ATCC MYA-4604 / CBS 118893) TaxID=535722 RepID=E4UZI7_ARTGP|nr:mitochondrial membrane protein Pet127 [Nannizzia gypsea CBS 118893]EFR03517.1 mitochondrial membrane protein Pet127 [Nannizzia gypsea CBS 118893]